MIAPRGKGLGAAFQAIDNRDHVAAPSGRILQRSIAKSDEPPVVTTSSTMMTSSPG